jgi:excisionase family DNA binding protein
VTLPDRIRAAIADAEPAEALGAIEVVRTELVVRLLVLARPPAPEPAGDEMLTAKQVARLLGTSARYVYEHAAQLGGVRPGGPGSRAIRFPRAKVERYLRARAL